MEEPEGDAETGETGEEPVEGLLPPFALQAVVEASAKAKAENAVSLCKRLRTDETT